MLSNLLLINCVALILVWANISDLISADAFQQVCLHLICLCILPAPSTPHTVCAQHRRQTSSFKTCQTFHSSAENLAMAPRFSQRKSQSARCPIGPSWSSFLFPLRAGLLLFLSLTLFQPSALLFSRYARPQGLCPISPGALLEICLANSLTTYESWLKSHLINEIPHH